MVFLAVNAKAALSTVLVALAVVGGCSARFQGKEDSQAPGSITGNVLVEGTDLSPVSAAGWPVIIVGHDNLQGAVTQTGSFVIDKVPAGTYSVKLVLPTKADTQAACTVPDCNYSNVAVSAGTATMHVDFNVSMMPAPPF